MAQNAQAPADEGRPAASNVRGAEYPRVHSDLRVTFRFVAPTAQKVQVQPGGDPNGLGRGPFDMARDDHGVWTVTTPPAVPGFHYYWLLVDGVAVNDPSSETYFGYGRPTSGVEVPEAGVDFYDAKDVPHGEVRARLVPLESDGAVAARLRLHAAGLRRRRADALPGPVPPARRGRGRAGWTTQGRANFILDNLIAEEKTRPMIVVMDCGYAVRAGAPAPVAQPGRPGFQAQIAAFEDVVLDDLIPLIDAHVPHHAGPGAPGDGRPLDGRLPDAPDHPRAPRPLRLRRRVQQPAHRRRVRSEHVVQRRLPRAGSLQREGEAALDRRRHRGDGAPRPRRKRCTKRWSRPASRMSSSSSPARRTSGRRGGARSTTSLRGCSATDGVR